VVTYTTKVLIPLKLVMRRVLDFYRLPVLVPYSKNTAIKNKKLRNVFLNCVVTYTTKVLIPLKLVMRRVLDFYRLPVLEPYP